MKGDKLHLEYYYVLSIYQKDFDYSQFQVQLETLSEYCKELEIISVHTIAEILKNLNVRNVIMLAKLILVTSATNSTSERSFSLLKLIKAYLRSTIKQNRHNHLMIFECV